GFLVGFLARPGSAAAVSLLILMPLSLAAGVFMPVSELPSIVRPIAELTPTYHAAELARWAGGVATTGVPLTDAAWVAGWAAIGTAVVVIAYRRFVGRQFA
ncbi:MAG TPA: ABC transporter permease, partial [Candidatus Limnocylindrales bacterium]